MNRYEVTVTVVVDADDADDAAHVVEVALDGIDAPGYVVWAFEPGDVYLVDAEAGPVECRYCGEVHDVDHACAAIRQAAAR